MAKNNGDFVSEPVPSSARRPWWEITFVTSGFCLAVSGMFAGAALTTGMSLRSVIVTILIGNLLLTLYGGFMGAIGANTGLATSVLAKRTFGKNGSIIMSLIFAVTLVGWFSVQAGFFGQTIHAMLPKAGFITSSSVASAWGGALMILTAFIGYKGIRILSNIAIPLLLILSFFGVILAISHAGGWASLTPEITKPITIMEGVVVVVGTFAVGAVIQPDISRFARSSKDSWLAMAIGMLIANGFIVFAGAVTAIAMGTGDLPAAMLQLGLGIPAILILIAAQWTSNDSNLYSSSLSFTNIFNVKRSKVVIILGAIGTLMGAVGIANYFIGFLSTLGVLIPPIAGVMIADYFVLNREKYKFDGGNNYVSFKWKSLIAWILGVAGGVLISWGIPSLNAIIIAFIIQIALNRIGEKTDMELNTTANQEQNI
ncbi:cytosine permease [Cytobacillus dafuensis]|uniref:Cytosine permease n=1 Tax=Cytobacillus dafuensis TaxID=1742359 RepID=A0A5B8Z0B5_CYTDA|nr:cytosine permease [Cytobacillus dafuensis]QED46402.1 cytosine permease [Cytobacillus dafuensis]